MDDQTDKRKRVISVGLVKPSNLEGNVIYVSLESGQDGLQATAVSNENFRYQCYASNRALLHRFGKETTNEDGNRTSRWLRPYKEFLDDLVANNEGVLDYHRLVKEGSAAKARLEEIQDLMAFKHISSDRIQGSFSPDC